MISPVLHLDGRENTEKSKANDLSIWKSAVLLNARTLFRGKIVLFGDKFLALGNITN